METMTFTDNFYPEKNAAASIRTEIEVEYYFEEEMLYRARGFPAPSRGDYVYLPNYENMKVRSVVHYPDRFLVIAYLVDPKDY